MSVKLIRYVCMKIERTQHDVTARFRGYQRVDKMHMLVRNASDARGRESLTLRLCGTNRDVISDDGINYWKAPDGQLFAVLISLGTFLPRPTVVPVAKYSPTPSARVITAPVACRTSIAAFRIVLRTRVVRSLRARHVVSKLRLQFVVTGGEFENARVQIKSARRKRLFSAGSVRPRSKTRYSVKG